MLTDILVGHTERFIRIATANRTYYMDMEYSLAETYKSFHISSICDMDLGDTFTIDVKVAGSTKTVSLFASAGVSFMSAHLIS